MSTRRSSQVRCQQVRLWRPRRASPSSRRTLKRPASLASTCAPSSDSAGSASLRQTSSSDRSATG
eukprot:7917178-Alexandrium_andersonii.AAC.1